MGVLNTYKYDDNMLLAKAVPHTERRTCGFCTRETGMYFTSPDGIVVCVACENSRGGRCLTCQRNVLRVSSYPAAGYKHRRMCFECVDAGRGLECTECCAVALPATRAMIRKESLPFVCSDCVSKIKK